MSNLTQLRAAAREIFAEALQAIDSGAAVRRAIVLNGTHLDVCNLMVPLGNRKIYSIAVGKAGMGMARALDEVLGPRLAAGIITANAARKDHASGDVGKPQAGMQALPRWQIFQVGHPEPNAQSLAAAQASFGLLQRAKMERAAVIFLISGGGSAMIEWPVDDTITLDDLITANKALVKCGASISEINIVRRAFSAIKGGRLAAQASDCDQVTLIISDVPAGQEQNVASGPSLAPSDDSPRPLDVIARYNLRTKLPDAILRVMKTATTVSDSKAGASSLLRAHFVLLDNQSALEAAAQAARRRGFFTEVARDISDQAIEDGCAMLLQRLAALRERESGPVAKNSSCLISGGEFACPVTGEGIGGRSLETALRLASARESSSSPHELFVSICAGTDGIDGNSPAAGAIIDHTTISRARAIGLDPHDFIKRSDAYSFFVALGDAISTGGTGTNVRDLRILLSTG
jgi:hydroxypyruvate reductase